MPTYTPSPKRFLVPTQQSVQKPKLKPPSNLRNAYTIHTPKPTTLASENSESFSSRLTPARRFVIAPHRHTQNRENAKVREHEAEAPAERHTQLTPRPKPRRKFERVESIEEPPKSSPDGPSYDDRGIGVLQTVEHDDAEERDEEQDDEDEEILFVTEERNKRRRVSPPTSPPTRQSSEPATPVTLRTHRFVVPPARTPAPFTATHTSTATISFAPVTATTTTPASHRPAFILPPQPTSPPKPSKPLPEIFSPSRKSQKYVPDGLASTMQSWIIETANTGFAAQERSTSGGIVWGRDREDGVKLRVSVKAASSSTSRDGESEVECFTGRFAFVRGETDPGMYNRSRAPSVVDNDGEIRVLLAGQGGARGAAGVKIKIGGIVGVRAPMWDVNVGGEKWMIGVDWVTL